MHLEHQKLAASAAAVANTFPHLRRVLFRQDDELEQVDLLRTRVEALPEA
jgi:hypothetical protein